MAKRKDIRLSLTDAPGTIVKVKEACALVRAWVEHRNEASESQITFKEAYSDAAKALKEIGIETAKPTPKRQNRMITARLACLEESEAVFLELALANYFLKGSTASQIRELFVKAKEWLTTKKSKRNDPVVKPTSLWDRTLNIVPGNRGSMDDFVGDYLIFRRLVAAKKFNVSHLKVLPQKCDAPLEFSTTGSIMGGLQKEPTHVSGLIWCSSDVFFSVGRVDEKNEIRTTMLEAVDKPVRHPNRNTKDLVGIRLGRSRLNNKPRAYMIWCARVKDETPDLSWSELVGDYDEDELIAIFARYVDGLETIIEDLLVWQSIELEKPLRRAG